MSLDHEIRIAAFDWLKGQVALHGDVLPRRLLAEGFVFSGRRIPLVSPQGIFRPKGLDYPLTITTTPEGPYDDKFNAQGLLRYRYRGENHFHRDNIGLREAMKNIAEPYLVLNSAKRLHAINFSMFARVNTLPRVARIILFMSSRRTLNPRPAIQAITS